MSQSSQTTPRRVALSVVVKLVLASLLLAAPGVVLSVGYLTYDAAFSDWAPRKIAESQRRGDVIVAAIQAYRQRDGRYPHSLEAMVPHFLERVEPPTAGKRMWIYEQDGRGYSLSFESESGGSASWRSNMPDRLDPIRRQPGAVDDRWQTSTS
jgi:hypothetical protein